MTEYWVENYSKKFTSSQNIFAKALGNTDGGGSKNLSAADKIAGVI